MGEVAETLLALLRSPNESTRLSACREICDRVLGRAAIAIDATHTRIDISQQIGRLYAAAMAKASSGQPANNAAEPPDEHS
jgi:hypothetical protein